MSDSASERRDGTTDIIHYINQAIQQADMTYRGQITSTTQRDETVHILYRAHITRPTISAQEGIANNVPMQIDTVTAADGDAHLLLGEEPESYIEKNRFYNEVQADVQNQFS